MVLHVVFLKVEFIDSLQAELVEYGDSIVGAACFLTFYVVRESETGAVRLFGEWIMSGFRAEKAQ